MLETLIGDLLDYNNLEAGQVALKPAWFSVGEIAAEACAAFGPAAAAQGLGLGLEVADSARVEAYGDARRLRRILDHLISNAVKFTTAGEVKVSVVARRSSGENLQFAFEVRDTGCGFDDKDVERLFGQFERADSSATRAHGGVGLGLAICRRLCDLMGATIMARSRPGAGASFTVVAPMPGRPAAEAPAVAQPVALRVLLADDNATNRRVLEMFLSAARAEVVSVENGQQAVEAAREQPFDLVLMDLQMPVMDGLTAIRTIRRIEAPARVPIIVISVNATGDDLEASAQAGADRHIAKPIRADQLFAAIAEVVGS
jgi:CheY-like chemotaxis protein/anti-sigma regulatory factor (Ser/Thr protein kinase)